MSDITLEPPSARLRRLPGARVLSGGRVIYWWLEIIAVLSYYFAYSAVRNADALHPDRARQHALQLIRFQKALGIYHEQAIHHWAVRLEPLIVTANYFYGSLHFIVTVGAAIFLFRKFPDDYPRWRNTLAIATALALIGFRFWPLMPPRLLPHHYGFIDTLDKYPTFWSFNSGAMKKISNQFAAMPSVHCCWALWCACALVPRLKSVWAKVLAGLYPVMTVTVIVVTANHYFLDAVGGFAIFGIGYVAARLLTRAGRPMAASAETNSRPPA
ncbi:MAG: phosphatase PAP2 family protein [Acidimicrobiia bacterium]|nr:phosphatase PAP2 family protein [Acidimicrobiia bacterium]